jgi:type II secretory pathway component GspD/PulD (secretin)
MKIRSLLIFPLCLLFLCVFIDSAPLQGEEGSQERISHRVFRIINRKASELEKLVSLFLSKEGLTASDDRANVLIVKDYPSNISKIEQFLAEADRPLPQVRIWVQFNDANVSSAAAWGLDGMIKGNSWRAGLWAGAIDRSSSSGGTMNLITMSGTWGEISCGEQILAPQWFFDYASARGYLSVTPVYRDVSTGFGVMPVVRGDAVELTVVPQISYFTDSGRNTIRYDGASTTVMVKDGQSVVMAAGEGEQSVVVQRILGSMNMRQSHSTSIILTPVIDRR